MKKHVVMKSLFKSLLVFGFALALVQQARAISHDFSTMGYADGQNLEGLVLDVAMFTSETGDLRYYTSYGGGIGTGYNWGGAADTYVGFSTPVSGITLTGGNGGGDYDAFQVFAYDFNTDALIGSWATPLFDGGVGPTYYTLSVPAVNVGRIVIDPGNAGVLPGVKEGLGGVVYLDMSYQTSNIPDGGATFGLLVLSLVVLFQFRRTAV